MGLFSSAKSAMSGVTGALTLGTFKPGSSDSAALLSGIPFVGEGFAQQESQRFNSAEAAKNREFQKEMANTKHQREVSDLKAAGLNPILSANTGAAVPSGSAASSSGMSGAGSSASMMRDLMNKTRLKAAEEIKTMKGVQKLQESQAGHFDNTADKAAAEKKLLDEQYKVEKVKGDFYKDYGRGLMWNDAISKGAHSAGQVLNAVGGAAGGLINKVLEGKKKVPKKLTKPKGKTKKDYKDFRDQFKHNPKNQKSYRYNNRRDLD